MNAEYLERRRVAIFGLLVSIALLVLKFWAFKLTRSQAIYSDAMESIVNVLAGISLLNIIRLASEPPDKNHPYGHGKFEYFSSAFEGGLISFAALAIIYAAVEAILKKQQLNEISVGLFIVAGCALVNLGMGFLLWKIGKRQHSISLQADGVHLMTDFVTSVGVLIGLFMAEFTGLTILDPLTAIGVAFFLIYSGIKILRHSAAGLTDEEDTGIIDRIGKILTESRIEGLIQVHHVRVIRSGRYHHIDAHAVVPEFWTVEMSHNIADDFSREFIQAYPVDGDMALHLDPCRRAYCRNCSLKDCLVRQAPFQSYLPVDAESLTNPNEPDFSYT